MLFINATKMIDKINFKFFPEQKIDVVVVPKGQHPLRHLIKIMDHRLKF